MLRSVLIAALFALGAPVLFVSARRLSAEETAPSAPAPVTFTTQEDHRNMMEQLGITKLRPGPSGNESAPNHANYDEALANPYPDLPPVLILKNGERITTADAWWKDRRPEIVEDFEREVYGRVPKDVPAVTWSVVEERELKIGDVPVVEKGIQGRVDNSACPAIEVNIWMTLTLPAEVKEPVPVLMMFGGFGPGGPRGNRPPGPPGRGFGPPGPSPREILVKAGWGVVTLFPGSIQADNGAGLTRGIIGLTNRGQPRQPDQWGALRAWGWGASRALDYLDTEPKVNAKRVGIEGVSRYGKGALVAMAFEPRFAAVLVGSSGEGGAKLHRRNFGEAVENLTGSGEYHWMAGNFLKYGAAESKFGSMTAGDLPVDSHELIALCAPRPTFISYGIPEKGDAKWLDQQGSFMATVGAGPVFRLLGAKDLGTTDDYQKEKMPAVNTGLLDGELAWRQHDGGHTDGPNIEHFVKWAEKHFPAAVSPAEEKKPAVSQADADRAVKMIPTKIEGSYRGGELKILRIGDRKAYIVRPTGTVDPKKRWLWEFPYWLGINDGFGNLQHRNYVEKALAAGFHVVGVDVGPSCASPAAAEVCQAFYRRLVDEEGLHAKARIMGQSHGGLIAYGWAMRNPACVERIAGICPATDFRSWPTLPNVIAFPEKGLDYGLSLQELSDRTAEFNPIDNLAPLAKVGVRILHIHGDQDELVPMSANSTELARRYKELDGKAEIVVIKGLGHGGQELYESDPLIQFLLGE